MSDMITPPLKYYGGKAYLAKYIHELAPKHIHRVILCAGGAQELWNWEHEGISEVINDIDTQLTNFYEVLQIKPLFDEFQRIISVTPFSQHEWEIAHNDMDYCRRRVDFTDEQARLTAAVSFFINCRQSWCGAGKTFTATTKTRVRRGMNAEISAWLNAVEGLPEVHQRLQRVLIRNLDVLECIKKEDSKGTLYYCDPPYFAPTRNADNIYAFEMSEAQHKELLEALCRAQGNAMISGYDNDLYREYLKSWSRNAIIRPNNAQKAGEKRPMEEIIWVKEP